MKAADEQLIVSLTSWEPRLKNIPAVLDSIFAQTVKPDLVVLNLAESLQIPGEIREYIDSHNVEVNRVRDTKVYKKLIPTLKKYPEACVISIDDDWIYPEGMIEDFMKIHSENPDSPVSGNREYFDGLKCHCGCASLTKSEFFGPTLDLLDDDLFLHCPSDDLAYTFMVNRNGHEYICTEGLYFENMQPIADNFGYSAGSRDIRFGSWDYLIHRFGPYDKPKEKLLIDIDCPDGLDFELAYFREKIYNISGIEWKIRENEAETADYILHLRASEDDMFALRNKTTEALLKDGGRFSKVLDSFLRNPEVGIACCRETYWVIPVLNHIEYFTVFPQIYMERPGRTKVRTFVGSRKDWFRKLLKSILCLDRFGPDRQKFLVLFGIAIKL